MEFKCANGHRFETVTRKREDLNDVKCPACKGEAKPVWSPFELLMWMPEAKR